MENYQIHLPNEILLSEELNSKQKNILTLLYFRRGSNGKTKLSLNEIVDILNLGCKQNVSTILIKPMINKYLNVMSDPKNKRKVIYEVILKNDKNFTQIDSEFYLKYCRNSELLFIYFKFKYVNNLFQYNIEKKKVADNEFEFIKIGNYNYMEFCEIKKILHTNKLIEFPEFSKMKFLEEKNVDFQVKIFKLNYNNKLKDNKLKEEIKCMK